VLATLLDDQQRTDVDTDNGDDDGDHGDCGGGGEAPTSVGVGCRRLLRHTHNAQRHKTHLPATQACSRSPEKKTSCLLSFARFLKYELQFMTVYVPRRICCKFL